MPEWIFQLIAVAGVTAGAYAGVRADLARLGARLEYVESENDRAHARIDDLFVMGAKRAS